MANVKSGRQQFQSVFGEVILATATVDPANATAGSFASVDVSVPGAAVGDFALAAPGVDTVDTVVGAAVTAENVVTVTVSNTTGGAVNLASSTWKIAVLKASIT